MLPQSWVTTTHQLEWCYCYVVGKIKTQSSRKPVIYLVEPKREKKFVLIVPTKAAITIFLAFHAFLNSL